MSQSVTVAEDEDRWSARSTFRLDLWAAAVGVALGDGYLCVLAWAFTGNILEWACFFPMFVYVAIQLLVLALVLGFHEWKRHRNLRKALWHFIVAPASVLSAPFLLNAVIDPNVEIANSRVTWVPLVLALAPMFVAFGVPPVISLIKHLCAGRPLARRLLLFVLVALSSAYVLVPLWIVCATSTMQV
jgi:hypothetical protein